MVSQGLIFPSKVDQMAQMLISTTMRKQSVYTLSPCLTEIMVQPSCLALRGFCRLCCSLLNQLRQVLVRRWCLQSLYLIQLWFGSSFVCCLRRALPRLLRLPAQQLHFCFFSVLLAWPALARCGPFLLENAGSGQWTDDKQFLRLYQTYCGANRGHWCRNVSVTEVLMEVGFC